MDRHRVVAEGLQHAEQVFEVGEADPVGEQAEVGGDHRHQDLHVQRLQPGLAGEDGERGAAARRQHAGDQPLAETLDDVLEPPHEVEVVRPLHGVDHAPQEVDDPQDLAVVAEGTAATAQQGAGVAQGEDRSAVVGVEEEGVHAP